MTPVAEVWPSPREFWEAVQSPHICFTDQNLRQALPALDRLGMPLVASGQFASVFKLNLEDGSGAMAVRCFRGFRGDRERRYTSIHNHLQKFPTNPLARFRYDTGGMIVGGRPYPILVMDWVEGATLDIYVGQVLKSPKPERHLRSLADEWLRVVGGLQSAAMAHGDLQHGNVLVNNGVCTLVDFDGLFVPALASFPATDNGHLNYQHPRRGTAYFDATIDRFSCLVIYLSLIALVHRPDIWREFHDENLLFKKTDFEHPAQSLLFRKIRETDPECRRLADELARACAASPEACPNLLDLVETKSRKPGWLSAPLRPVFIPTREVKGPAQPLPEFIGPVPVPLHGPPLPRPRVAAAPPVPRTAPAWTRPAPVITPLSWIAQVRLAAAWSAVLAVLASFVPVLQPWAAGAALVFIGGGWPLLRRWRIGGRFAVVWGLVFMLAVSVSAVSVPTLLSRSNVQPQAVSSQPVLPAAATDPAANSGVPTAAQQQAAEHVAKAESLLGQSDFTQAQAECDLALSLDPQNARALWLRDQISKTRAMMGGRTQ